MQGNKKTTNIFLHNFRCSGNSLNLAIRNYFMDDHLKYGMVNEKNITYEELIGLAKSNQPKFILGHNVFGLHQNFDFPCRYFVNFRDPLERLISGYVNWSSQDKHTLEEYYNTHKERSNGMTYRLLGYGKNGQDYYNFLTDTVIDGYPLITEAMFEQAIENLENYADVILVSELINESFILMEEKLNLPELICPQGIHFNQSKTFLKVEHFSKQSLDWLQELNVWDYKLYSYAKDKLSAEIAAKGENFLEKVRIRKMFSALMKVPLVDIIDGGQVIKQLQEGVNKLLFLGMNNEAFEMVRLFINSINVETRAGYQIISALKHVFTPVQIQDLTRDLEKRDNVLRKAS